jgi:hypothetical protein
MLTVTERKKRRKAPKAAPPAANPWPDILVKLRAKLGNIDRAAAAKLIGASERAWFYWEAGKHVPARPYQRLIEQLKKTS